MPVGNLVQHYDLIVHVLEGARRVWRSERQRLMMDGVSFWPNSLMRLNRVEEALHIFENIPRDVRPEVAGPWGVDLVEPGKMADLCRTKTRSEARLPPRRLGRRLCGNARRFHVHSHPMTA